ncbi:putative ribonuclease H protein [Glycine max]|nr:putative ribonuclease H protein [Glycine max]
MGEFKDSGWEWDFKWRRPLFDNEIDMAVSFLQELEGNRIRSHRADQWVWVADSSGQYTVRSAYNVLREDLLQEDQDGEFKELWKVKVPSKVIVFAWRLLKDRLPTRDNLRRKHVELQDFMCPFCRTIEESAGHLFFHCSKVFPIWCEMLSWVNLVGVFPHHPRHHFLQHIYGAFEGIQLDRWKGWWLALTWTIWKHRNSIVFSNSAFNANKVVDDAVFLLWTWLKNFEKDFTTHYNQWSSNLSEGFFRRRGFESRFNNCISLII